MIRILIVEDEKPISELMRLSLTKAGYSCHCAYDGGQAADILRQAQSDCEELYVEDAEELIE